MPNRITSGLIFLFRSMIFASTVVLGIGQNFSLLSYPSNQFLRSPSVGFDDLVWHNITFNSSSNDLMVLVHIQKTGGTAFEKHLVLDLKYPSCRCETSVKRQCSCPRRSSTNATSFVEKTWLVSRFSTGWVCGLHPDFTLLNYCLQGLERLFYITFIRHPLYRFVSEYRHIQRGATWKSSISPCTRFNTSLCFSNRDDWSNATLDEFLSCTSNMAINRQTRMLADLENITCENEDGFLLSRERGREMLASAKKNLDNLAFFGICEHQFISQKLFEKAFKVSFTVDFKQSDDTSTKSFVEAMSMSLRANILETNHLDVELYEHAIQVFSKRCKKLFKGCDNLTNFMT